MNMIDNIIDLANKQVGIKENPIGSNNVIYNTEYYGHPVSGSGYAWCVVFCWWLFKQCGLSYLFFGGSKTASCTTLLNYAKSKGLTTNNPAKGDLVIFEWENGQRHIGIIEKVTSKTIYTIEGNCSDCVKKMKRDYKNVIGFIHPEYTEIKYTVLPKNSIWSQPIKQDAYRERYVEQNYPITVYLNSFKQNDEFWYKTIKGKYVLAKCFDE